MPYSFSIVIPVYNGGHAFKMCLKAVEAAVRPQDEIIVVADGESDGAWRISPDYGARVVNLSQNGGPGRARNSGAQEARGDILFFVDADVVIRPDALQLIEAAFDNEPELAALMGSYDETPYHTNFLSQYKNLLHHYVHQQGSEKASSFWGACGAVRRDLFLKFGGFKESYTRASIEDIELGYRLYSSGHSIRLLKTLQVTHLKRWTTWNLIKTEIFLRGAPWTRLLWRQLWRSGKATNDLNLDIKHKLSLIASAGLVASIAAAFFSAWFLVVTGLLAVAFLGLNWPMVRFFYDKRGVKFAAGAAFWRFIYDVYSWISFVAGSTDTGRGALRRLTALTFSRLDGVALGAGVGAASGGGLFCATAILLIRGNPHEGLDLALLAQFLPGYSETWSGAFIGFLEAFVLGYVFGWLFAVIRNFSMRIALGREKIGRAMARRKAAAAS